MPREVEVVSINPNYAVVRDPEEGTYAAGLDQLQRKEDAEGDEIVAGEIVLALDINMANLGLSANPQQMTIDDETASQPQGQDIERRLES